MKVLVACEFSGVVREAFRREGHDAWSCDLRNTEIPGQHLVCDVREILNDGWDMMIAHPPCTYTSGAGYRWFNVQPDRMDKARAGYDFFMQMVNAPIEKIAVENTRGLLFKWYRKPDQIVNPCDFGHPVTKATCFWLKNLPPLMASMVVINPMRNWTSKQPAHNEMNRSRTFEGVAAAMARQWK